MDGKVEISILQFNELQDKLKKLETENAEHRSREKMVKIVTVDKNYGGFHKYNPWADRNEFVKDERTVESAEYKGLEDVIRVLRDEEEHKVKEAITKVKLEKHELEQNVENLKLNHDKKLRETTDKFEKKIDKLKEDHASELKKIADKHSNEIAEKDKVIAELEGKKVAEAEKSEIEKLKAEIERLTNENATLKTKKRGWWS